MVIYLSHTLEPHRPRKRKREVAPTHCSRFSSCLSFNKGLCGSLVEWSSWGAPGLSFNASEMSCKVWNPKAEPCLRLSCRRISGSGVLLLPLIACVTLGKPVLHPLASISSSLEEDCSAPHLRMATLFSAHLLLYDNKLATQCFIWHTIRSMY